MSPGTRPARAARPEASAGPSPRGMSPAADGGFTLLEAVVVLAILGVLAGAFVPLVITARETDRADATRHRLALLKQGIAGRAHAPGEAEPDFGFVGDLGQLPADLEQLVRPGSLPAFSLDPQLGLGVGWRGPYLPTPLAEDTVAFDRDAFGRPLRYAVKDTTLGGLSVRAFLQSSGADGARGTGDDLFAPLLPVDVGGEVHLFLTDGRGRSVISAPVGLLFRRSGTVVDTAVLTDGEGRARVADVPAGELVTRARSAPSGQRTGFVAGTESTGGGSFEDVEFTILDVAPEAVTLTSLTVTSIDPNTDDRCYREAYVGGIEVLAPGGGSARCEGETLTFPEPVTLETGTASPASITRRRFRTQRPPTLAPALRYGDAVRGGTGAADVLLGDWRTGGGTGAQADMRGVELTVQFSDGLLFSFTAPG